MSTTNRTFTRRRLLEGTAAGVGTAALASCAPDHFVSGDVNVVRVHTLPLEDPDDRRWLQSPVLDVELGPQDMALPLNLQPAVTSLRVRALHDHERIAFLLEWDDADIDDLTVRVDDFRDACAVLLASGPPSLDLRPMGTAASPATLLHWKADWQRDVDEGRQGLDAVYPNRSVDVYPPLWDAATADVEPGTYADAQATMWLPGIHVDNPISLAGRATPVEKAIAYGFGTTATAATQNAAGRGFRTDAGWRVIISRPLGAVDDGEVSLTPGANGTCAFAVWSGGADEVGSRKAPSRTVYSIVLER
jgi:hypothetical protein